MLAYNWLLALVAFVVSLPLAFVLRVVQRRLVAAYDRARARNGEMLGRVSELVTGAETIRAYDAGRSIARRDQEAVRSSGPTPRSGPT
jgi:ATP-binding cassette, subfamily B, bacterial